MKCVNKNIKLGALGFTASCFLLSVYEGKMLNFRKQSERGLTTSGVQETVTVAAGVRAERGGTGESALEQGQLEGVALQTRPDQGQTHPLQMYI